MELFSELVDVLGQTPDWVPTPGMTVGIEGNAEPKTGDEGLLTLTSAQLEHPTETGADRIRATKVRGGAVLAFMLLGRADRILKEIRARQHLLRPAGGRADHRGRSDPRAGRGMIQVRIFRI